MLSRTRLITGVVAFALGVLLFSMPMSAQMMAPPPEKPASYWEARGREVVQMLAAGQFDKIEAEFDRPMQAALPHGKLAEGWTALAAQMGAFQKIDGAKVEPVQIYQRVRVACQFARGNLVANVVFNEEGKLSGLQFHPAEMESSWTPPEYADQAVFHEQASDRR